MTDRDDIQGSAFCDEHIGTVGNRLHLHIVLFTPINAESSTQLQAPDEGQAGRLAARFALLPLGVYGSVSLPFSRFRFQCYMTPLLPLHNRPSKCSGDGEANRNENWHCTNQRVSSPSEISELGIICWLLTKSQHLIETKSTKFRTHSQLYLHLYACIPSDCSFQYISATNGSNLHKKTARWTV